MEEGKKHIDDLFREELGNYQEAPPPAVWASLDQRLPVAGSAHPPAGGAVAADAPSRRWLWYLLLLALLATLIYFGARNMFTNRSGGNLLNENTNSKPASATSGTKPFTDNQNINPNKEEHQEITASGESTERTYSHRPKADAPSSSGIDENKPITSTPAEAIRATKTKNNTTNLGGTSNNAKTPRQKKVENKRHQANPDASTASTIKSPNSIRNGSAASNSTEGANNTQEVNDNRTARRNDYQANQTGTPPDNIPPAAPNTVSEAPYQSGESVTIKRTTTKKSHMVVTVEDNNKPMASKDLPKDKEKTNAIASRTESNYQDAPPSNEPTVDPTSLALSEEKGSVAAGTSGKTPARKVNTSADKQPQHKTTDPISTERSPDLSTDSHATTTSPSSLSAKNTPASKRRTRSPKQSSEASALTTTSAATAIATAKSVKKANVAKGAIKGHAQPSEQGRSSAASSPAATEAKKSQPGSATGKKANAKQAQASIANVPGSNRKTPAPEPQKTTSKSPVEASTAIAPASSATVVKQDPETAASAEATGEDVKGTSSGSDEAGGGPSTPLRNFRRINFNADAGIKLGYEKGFGSYGTSGFIFAPFLQWNISPKVSLVLQPGFRYNQLNNTTLLTDASYHKITSQTIDSQLIVTLDSLQQVWIERQYFYANTYDSLKAGFKFQSKSYWEIDLPLMLQYYITKQLAITGGISLTFGGFNEIKGSVSDVIHREVLDTVKYAPVPINNPPPTPPDYLNHFSYNTLEYNVINPAAFNNPSSSPARFGAILGLSYSLNDRLMVDVLVRKNLSDMKFVPNEQMRKIYTQPYFRFTIGYKMFRSRK
jgi:hypothetical protein